MRFPIRVGTRGRTLYPNRPKPTQTDLNQPNQPAIIVITLIISPNQSFHLSKQCCVFVVYFSVYRLYILVVKVIFIIIIVQFCSIKNILFAYVTMYNDYIIRFVI